MDNYNNNINKNLNAIYKQIDAEYEQMQAEINEQLKQLKNEKEKREKIIAVITALILANWKNIKKYIDTNSVEIIDIVYGVYFLNSGMNTQFVMTRAEIADIMRNSIKARKNAVNYTRLINSNANKTRRAIRGIILNGLEKGEVNSQISKKISKRLNVSKNRAKSIARTETNFYRTEAQLIVGDKIDLQGGYVKKTWIYTFRSKEPRKSHIEANGQVVIGINGKFIVNGKETIAPQHFGDPAEDINCKCIMEMEVIKS